MGAFPPDPDLMGESRFSRSRRIRTGSEIRAILRDGRRGRGACLDLFTAPAPGDTARFGVIVPRYGRNAVQRNLLRRRLKEIGRTDVLPALRALERNIDVLVRTRPPAYLASFPQLREELLGLTERLCSDASS